MNKARRKQIAEIKDRIETAMQDLQSVLGDEQDYYDNIPENLQGSMRAMETEDGISSLEEAVDNLDSAVSSLDEVL